MYKFMTKDGMRISIPASTMEHMEAHKDVDFAILNEALKKISFKGDFLKTAVDMGRVIGTTSCVEVGPEDDISYYYRKNRAGKTPFVKGRDKKDTSKIVIILRKTSKGIPILITSWYGDIAPMEPWDARRKNLSDEEIEECDIFWNTHALIYDESMIDFDKV